MKKYISLFLVFVAMNLLADEVGSDMDDMAIAPNAPIKLAYVCQPNPLVPGLGLVVKIYEPNTGSIGRVEVILKGEIKQLEQVYRALVPWPGFEYRDFATQGQALRILMKSVTPDHKGYFAEIISNSVSSNLICMFSVDD